MRPIQLRSVSPYGDKQYVGKPPMGSLQPDWFSVYTPGYGPPLPVFDVQFRRQFFERAQELGVQNAFVMECASVTPNEKDERRA